jgi:hypothetical protein
MHSLHVRKGRMACVRLVFRFLFVLLVILPLRAFGDEPPPAAKPEYSTPPAEPFQRLQLVFEPDAYYTSLDLILALTKAPIPQLGELTEAEIYGALLSRAALLPRFLVLEASVNPMPYLGTYIRRHNESFYNDAQLSGDFNWVKVLTAGFEEPYAFSLLAGNVANFDITGKTEATGLGYSGYLVSAGNYHIRNNELIQDDWREIEWKMKGDRKSPVKKLSWSFRIGAKLHANPHITDTVYLSVRRSRVDYQQAKEHSLFSNSGFEYTFDLDRRTRDAIRHYFFVDKKWPFQNSRMAFSLAAGFVWDSAKKYTGPLADDREDEFQFILRPNIEF